MKMNLPEGKIMSTALKAFGAMLKGDCLNLTESTKTSFSLHLKESELRWNMRINNANIYQELLKNFREKPF